MLARYPSAMVVLSVVDHAGGDWPRRGVTSRHMSCAKGLKSVTLAVRLRTPDPA